jgi:hypothetical protein
VTKILSVLLEPYCRLTGAGEEKEKVATELVVVGVTVKDVIEASKVTV